MDCSSEDSFTWTDTSSDSIESHMAPKGVERREKALTKSDNKNGKKGKSKQLSNKSTHSEDNDTKLNVKIENEQSFDDSCSMKRKTVKLEPDSESDIPKKRRRYQKTEDNKSHSDTQDSASYDDSYLDFKVKQEIMYPPSAQKTKKKKKHKVLNLELETFDKNTPDENGHNLIISEPNTCTSKKKKKKSKKESYQEHQDDINVNDVRDTEEPTLDKSYVRSNNKLNIKRQVDTSLTKSYTIQDETNYSEISAIQGDERHDLTFNNTLSAATVNKNDSQGIIVSQSVDKRVPRISDRLLFEEDADKIELHKNIETSLKLKKWLKGNDEYRKIPCEFPHNKHFSNDDEIWMVKCPKDIDVEALNDFDINIDAKCKIKICGQTYDGSIDSEHSYPGTVLRMKDICFEVKNLPLNATINLRKRIPKAHFRDDNVMVNNQTNFIPLPETKLRHPLFGTNYKKAIKIPAAIKEKLNPENNIEIKKIKKKKHKTSKSKQDYDETNVPENISTPKAEPDVSPETAGMNRRKRKNNLEDESSAPKRMKRTKPETVCATAWESEKAIEKTLFDF